MKPLSIKDCTLIDCISFTIVSLILSTLAFFSDLVMGITAVENLQLFLCTSLIAVLMYFTSKLQIKSQLMASILLILDVATVIYGVGGGVLNWFPWKPGAIAEVGLILLLVFFVTNGIMMWHTKELADAINKKLEERER